MDTEQGQEQIMGSWNQKQKKYTIDYKITKFLWWHPVP